MPVFPPGLPTFPPSGQQWVTPEQVQGDKRLDNLVLPDGITLAAVCTFASRILFARSGSRFNATALTVRPNHLSVSCGYRVGMGTGWGWGGSVDGGWFNGMFPEGWGGCTESASELVLEADAPIDPDSITVTVDGVVLTAQGQANEQWHLYSGRRLVRMLGPTGTVVGTPGQPGVGSTWPCCQNLSLPAGSVGTWSVSYIDGALPEEASTVAYDLAVEYALALGGKSGKLPSNTTAAVRKGVSLALTPPSQMAGPLPSRLATDWISAVNPNGLQRRATVHSIDTIRQSSG